jgi:glutathione S-transferase
MLEELGRPYRTEVLHFGETMKTPEYLRINPMGKVPALRHADTVITEVAAICAYLADAFPQAGLAPAPTSRARGTYYRWMFFAAGPIESCATNRALGVTIPVERERMMGYGSYELAMQVLEQAVSSVEYLVDGRFSAADVYVGSHIGFGMQFKTFEKRPAFERYWARLNARPAKQRADAIDNALLPASA